MQFVSDVEDNEEGEQGQQKSQNLGPVSVSTNWGSPQQGTYTYCIAQACEKKLGCMNMVTSSTKLLLFLPYTMHLLMEQCKA
jgi:hypothetical protein